MTHPELPSSIESERSTLGSILLNRDAIIAVAPFLHSAHFFLDRHCLIYDAMLACYLARTPPDTRTVSEELRRRGQLDRVGGISYLSDLVDTVPTSYHVEYYARAVESTALRRKLIAAGGKIASMGYDEQIALPELVGQAQQTLFDAATRAGDSALSPIGDVATEFYASLESDISPAIRTGYIDLDEVLGGGLHRGDLIVLAARPGVGKSSLALQIALHIAEQGSPAPIYSLEMSRMQLLERLAAVRCKLDLLAIRERRLNDDELALLLGELGELAKLPIYVDAAASQTPSALRNAAHRFRAASEHPIGVLIVDYLQLMSAPEYKDNRVQEVSAISRGLKLLAKELDCPVLALCQLSRDVEKRTSHIPVLSDLRDSGAIEQDSDIVLFLYREELYDRDTDKKGVAELYIAKHRGGPLGVVPLRFDPPTTRFDTLTYRQMGGPRWEP